MWISLSVKTKQNSNKNSCTLPCLHRYNKKADKGEWNMNINKIAVAAPGSYPPIQVIGPNRKYADMILQDIAAAKGEMTTVYQYFYQNWCLEEIDPDLALLLNRIAQVEIKHLDLLGRLVVLLGANPVCLSRPGNRNSAWNGNMINYHHGEKFLLSYNIRLEQSTLNNYIAQARMIKDPYICDLLNRIAQDEELHRDLFTEYLEFLEQ